MSETTTKEFGIKHRMRAFYENVGIGPSRLAHAYLKQIAFKLRIPIQR